MVNVKVLIVEFVAVDRLSTTTITTCEVTALGHKSWDDSVEFRILVVKGLSRVADAS